MVTAGLDSVAIRMPSHPVARALIEACGLPIAAPSGNRSGRPSPTLAAHMLEDMDGRVPLILDGGACDVGVESTVVALTGDIATVLRPGGITPDMLAGVLGQVQVADSVMRPLKEGEAAPSPGMKHKHYAPRARMTLYEGTAEAVAARIRSEYDALPETERALILARQHCTKVQVELLDDNVAFRRFGLVADSRGRRRFARVFQRRWFVRVCDAGRPARPRQGPSERSAE